MMAIRAPLTVAAARAVVRAPQTLVERECASLKAKLAAHGRTDPYGLCGKELDPNGFYSKGPVPACSGVHLKYHGSAWRKEARAAFGRVAAAEGKTGTGQLYTCLLAAAAEVTDVRPDTAQKALLPDFQSAITPPPPAQAIPPMRQEPDVTVDIGPRPLAPTPGPALAPTIPVYMPTPGPIAPAAERVTPDIDRPVTVLGVPWYYAALGLVAVGGGVYLLTRKKGRR